MACSSAARGEMVIAGYRRDSSGSGRRSCPFSSGSLSSAAMNRPISRCQSSVVPLCKLIFDHEVFHRVTPAQRWRPNNASSASVKAAFQRQAGPAPRRLQAGR